MKKQLIAWQLIHNSLQQNIPVMLLYVLESKGSSPGRQGFFMAVNANHEIEGSIGGGIMEHKFVEMAKERLKDTRHKAQETGDQRQNIKEPSERISIKKQIHNKSAPTNQSGMICSGEQTILLYQLQHKDKDQVEKIISSVQRNKNGTLKLSPKGIEFSESLPETDFHFSIKSDQDWQYQEKTGYKNRLFVIGGGHCALAFSRLMRDMDFYIIVYDERANLKTMIENKYAHEKHYVNDYSELTRLVPPGNSHYVVIMTFGYRTDDVALRMLLNKDFKYLGLLGSKSKIEKMFEDYRKEGIKENLLQRICTPIGLPIKSQTPEEIAVSIAAEIIKVKNS
jgi:xanthine dehydrogenase accessory factor